MRTLIFLFLLMNTAFANYLEHPNAKAFMNKMASKHHFQAKELRQVFASATYQNSIIKAISKPAEAAKPWSAYRKIFITNKRINDGKQFIRQNKIALERAQETFGVPYQYIAAIIGVETSYGQNMGSYRVIDALSTLAFDYPKRSEFFTQELEKFLLLTRQQGFNPLTLKGSYAGAMGYGQFMPSSFLAYAVDFDGDGKADIWHNKTDAIGSVANYFQKHGWEAYQNVVALPTEVAGNVNPACFQTKTVKPSLGINQIKACGLMAYDDMNAPATPLWLEGENGDEFWLTYNNFYTITRYNHSNMYALAVTQLADYLFDEN
jgi:membrane-bound lytic murein transglycosylase B